MFKPIKYAIELILLVSLMAYAVVLYCPKPKAKPSYEKIFSRMYVSNNYGSSYVPQEYQALIQQYLLDPNIKTIISLGCAGWRHMAELNIPNDTQYICYDVVPQIIHEANDALNKDNIHFYYVESLEDFIVTKANGDLFITTDFLNFWQNKEIQKLIQDILPKFKYAMLTNTYTKNKPISNKNVGLGVHRAINLLASPFDLPNTHIILEYDDLKQPHKHIQVLLSVSSD